MYGKGFYLTSYEEQARKWAERKGMRLGKIGIVNIYDMKDEWNGLRVLSFEKENEKWLECIANQKILDHILMFKKAYEVGWNGR